MRKMQKIVCESLLEYYKEELIKLNESRVTDETYDLIQKLSAKYDNSEEVASATEDLIAAAGARIMGGRYAADSLYKEINRKYSNEVLDAAYTIKFEIEDLVESEKCEKTGEIVDEKELEEETIRVKQGLITPEDRKMMNKSTKNWSSDSDPKGADRWAKKYGRKKGSNKAG